MLSTPHALSLHRLPGAGPSQKGGAGGGGDLPARRHHRSHGDW